MEKDERKNYFPPNYIFGKTKMEYFANGLLRKKAFQVK